MEDEAADGIFFFSLSSGLGHLGDRRKREEKESEGRLVRRREKILLRSFNKRMGLIGSK